MNLFIQVENDVNNENLKENSLSKKDKKDLVSLKVEINERGMKGDEIKKFFKQFINKVIETLNIYVYFNSILDNNSIIIHCKCYLLCVFEEFNISIETIQLHFPTFADLLSKSFISEETLNEIDIKVFESFIEFFSYNLLFLHYYSSQKNIYLKKILYNDFLFTNSFLENRVINGIFLKKSIFNVNRIDLNLIDNLPPNYWELCINLFEDTIYNSEKLFSRTHTAITENLRFLNKINDYDYLERSKESFILPRILISLDGDININSDTENFIDKNNIVYFYKYMELVSKRYSNIIVNMVINVPDSNKMMFFKNFLLNSFKNFKGILLILKKENQDSKEHFSSFTLSIDSSAITNFIKLPFNFIRILYFDENKNLIFQYKRNYQIIVDLIIIFKISKTSRVRGNLIKRSTLLNIKEFIY